MNQENSTNKKDITIIPEKSIRKNTALIAKLLLFSIFVVLLTATSLASFLTDQAANVRINGTLVQSANLTVSIYNTTSGGTPIYTELFQDAVSGGSWDITLGETAPLTLEYGKTYYMDQLINTVNLDYKNNTGGTVDRKAFISTMGLINSEDINPGAVLTIAGLNIAGNLNVTGSIISPVLASMPNLSLSQIADNIGNFSAWSNSTFITADNFSNWVNASGLVINWSGIGDNLAWQTLGNWSADKSSYSTTSEANNLYAPIAEPIALTLGNWSADKSSYATNTALTNNYSALDSKYNTIGNWSNDKIGKLFWTDSAGNATFTTGSVGIGTTNPTSTLSFGKLATLSIATSDGNDNGTLKLAGGGTASNQRGAVIVLSGNEESTYGGNILLNPGVNAESQVQIDNTLYVGDGNVGIGTTNPSYKLDVETDVYTSDQILAFLGTSVGWATEETGRKLGISMGRTYDYPNRSVEFGYGAAGSYGQSPFFYISPKGSEALRITSTGNVGIGTSSPGAKLEVDGIIKQNSVYSNVVSATQIPENNSVGIKIKTNVPFNSGVQLVTLFIDGYEYRLGKPIGLSVSWYVYGSPSAFIKKSASSWGSYYPDITLANEDGKVVVYLDGEGDEYYSMFKVTAISSSDSSPQYFQDWSVVREAITGNNITAVPYKNSFGDVNIMGQVGIGTSSPGAKLDVDGNIHVADNASIGTHSTTGLAFSGAYVPILNAGSSAYINIDTDVSSTGAYLEIAKDRSGTSGGTVLMGVQENGNVGIGTDSPSASSSALPAMDVVLQIGDNTKAPELRLAGPNSADVSSKLVFDNSATGDGMSIFFTSDTSPYGNDGLVFWDESSDNARIKINRDDGNVGIGTTNPLQKLDVAGNISLHENNYIYLHTSTDANWKFGKDSNDNIYLDGYQIGSRRFAIRDAANGFAERFVVQFGGNVGIGTTTPSATLEVEGDVKVEKNITTSTGSIIVWIGS